MDTTSSVFAGGFVVALVAACGGSTSSDGTAGNGASGSDIATYQQLATDTRSAASSYRMSMMATDVTPASCQAIHDHYDGQVRPWLSRMMQMSPGMDDFMDAHDGTMAADMSCVSAAMMDELDHHRATACTFADVSADQAEAVRHSGAMVGYSGHCFDRSGEMMNGSHGGAWSWGSMMDGCRGWQADGGIPHDAPGDAQHDGGMMQGGGMMGGR